jgi:hypothetical protein
VRRTSLPPRPRRPPIDQRRRTVEATGARGAGDADGSEDKDDVDGIRAAARAATTLGADEDRTTLAEARGRRGRSVPAADREQDRARREQRRAAFANRLGTPGRFGIGRLDCMRLDSAGERGTLAGDLLATFEAKTPAERAAAVDALAQHPELVSTWVAVPEVRGLLARLHKKPGGPIVKREMFPLVRRWAVRLAWDELAVQDAAQDRGPGWFLRYGRRFHTRAMVPVVKLLGEIADDPEPFATAVALANKLLLRPHERELLLLKLLGERWRRRVAIMLACGPNALRKRWWRLRQRVERDDLRKGAIRSRSS